MLLTSRPPTAHGAITRILTVPANIPDTRIVQALVLKRAPIQVLDAPETACGDGGGLRARGHVDGGGGRVGHGGCGEGAEELGQEGHGEVGEEGEEERGEDLQLGDCAGRFSGLEGGVGVDYEGLCKVDLGGVREGGWDY